MAVDRRGITVGLGEAADSLYSHSGQFAKAPVQAASTANLTLSGEQTVDDVALVAEDRILVKDQTTASENGIYIVSTGPWTRSPDFDGEGEVVKGTQIFVIAGTANATGQWYVSSDNVVTIGTDALTFAALTSSFSGPGGGSTDNALTRFNGTSGVSVQNSGVILDDSNNLTGVAALTLSGTLTGASGTWGSGGMDIAASDSYAIGGVNILADSSGTTTLSNIDALDATTEATIEAAIDTLSNLTTVGALDSGSITSNFGAIDIGTSTMSSGGVSATNGTSTTSVNGNSLEIGVSAGDNLSFIDWHASSGDDHGFRILRVGGVNGDTQITQVGTGDIAFSVPTGVVSFDSTITGPSGSWDSSGMDLAASDSYAIGGVDILSDAAGTTTLSNIDALDATTEATIEAAIDTLPNLTITESQISDLSHTGDVTKVGTPANNEIGVWTGDGTLKGDSNFLWAGNALVTYDPTNDASPIHALGSSASERLIMQTVYASGTQEIDYVEFATRTANATANRGRFIFDVDGTDIFEINDGGIDLAASSNISIGAIDIIADSSGTTTLSNIDALDATTEATIEAAIDTLTNLTITESQISDLQSYYTLAGNLQDLDTLGVVSTDGQMIVGTGAGAFAYESGATLRTSIGVDAAGTDNSTNVTLAGEDYLSLSGQEITAIAIDLDNLSASGTPSSSTFLRGDNTWATPSGSGDVSKVGTPANNEVGVWTGDGTIEGDSNFTWSGTLLDITGALTASGTITGPSGTWNSSGIDIAASDSYSIGAVTILSDAAGTTTLSNIDALDATTEATIEAAIDTLSNLTTTGALNAGSITSGFGAIDVGTDDITGGTINATGDTAAGDNAAMGYTAAEGLILTGQGSTGDVTVKNDADAIVFQVPTGTTQMDLQGGQIKFPATQNASADANVLDDYEEGDFTPGLSFATVGNLSVTFSTQIGTYTKIGNRCFFTLFIVTATFTHTTAASFFIVTGFPFNMDEDFIHIGHAACSGWTRSGFHATNLESNSVNSNWCYVNMSGDNVVQGEGTVTHWPTATQKRVYANGNYKVA